MPTNTTRGFIGPPPVPLQVKERDEQGEETGERRTLFRVAHVFDVSQTQIIPGIEPAPLAPPGADGIGGDSHADLLPALEQLAADSGYGLSWVEELPGTAKGRCHRRERTIEVLAEPPANDRVQVLIHELCHALASEGGELSGFSYGLEEVVVESATFIACASVGLQTDVESVPYLVGRTWAVRGRRTGLRPVASSVEIRLCAAL